MKFITQFCLFLSIPILLAAGCASAPATSLPSKVLWFDGVEAPAPLGALLTNNPGYFGKSIHTDVTYNYEQAPTNPADVLGRDVSKFGNRLFDGQPAGDWFSPVGINDKPLVIDFDFHQKVTLNEITIAQFRSADLKLAEVQIKNSQSQPWIKVLLVANQKGALHHLVFSKSITARFVQLTLQSTSNITYISQIWMWGEAKAVPVKSLNGFFPEIKNFPETQNAKPGDETILSAAALHDWRKRCDFHKNAITWQIAPTWEMLKKNPLQSTFLPGKNALEKPVQMSVTQTEGESAAVFLINASDHAKDVTVHLDDFKNQSGKSTSTIKSTLYIAGAIWTRRWGQTLRPLFSADNKLGGEQMEKYLTNGSVIKDFPILHLPPRGTAMLWITAQTQNAASGNYSAVLRADKNTTPIHLKVLSVTLPQPNVWVRFWGNAPASTTNLWSSENAIRNEIIYQQSMGASVWSGWPTDGSYQKIARELAKQQGRHSYFINGISPEIRDAGYTGKLDPANFDDDFQKKIQTETQQMVQTAQNLGLDYDDWSMELWDEPTSKNMQSWAAVARLIKAENPKIQLYMNPLFWTREGTNPGKFADDEYQVEALNNWYNQLVDISVPILGQVDTAKYPKANQQFYNHLPRAVRAFYIHPNPGRMLSWEAFARDYNGWGFYAYYSPRKDAWNDFDAPGFDYQIVYPGPNGFIPTIESESMRESWEDYQLLTLLKQQGRTAELNKILNAYKTGTSDIPTLRNRMLQDVTSNKDNVTP
jgi:hypothetical protein